MTSETDLNRLIQLDLSIADTRLFRNNVGHAWQGKHFTIHDGKLVSGVARNIAFGLGEGSSDLIGLRSLVITPAMVGRRVAVFTAIEGKRPSGKIKVTAEQESFIAMVNRMGGQAGVARSIEDASQIVTQFEFRC